MSKQRYRITVTPLELDGRPASGNALEFEQRSSDNWMRTLEKFERQRGLCGDRCAALAVGIELLKSVSAEPHAEDRAIAHLRPHLDSLLAAAARLPKEG
ncbi:DUF3861 family protein [Stenotrophomonas sp. HITSZ_GD]|uniref:DUF3861 family protein n=1 Tax=Stenotrophomonas sp. HITSZ_GD TaxID=3037248 RepID=UPI00240E72AE|nr:DUF3861 family protein [Stenotrophomonas sp. HITSZ_GD]MDG2525543.1 DUF3861 family protein [Stenotrophomonas sp. HITSZ_GD]